MELPTKCAAMSVWRKIRTDFWKLKDRLTRKSRERRIYMDTIKFSSPKKPRMIAHRGVSGLETENTCASFVAAGNRSYFGIETDVHRTRDGQFVIFHDDSTKRVSGVDLVIEKTDYETLRKLPLMEKNGTIGRTDLRIPNLREYIGICRHYGKTAVLELKNHFPQEDVYRICDIIEEMDYLPNVIFISFDFENLVNIKKRYPDRKVQFLTNECDGNLVARLKKYGMDLDIYYGGLDAENAALCRENGIELNCWTVDTPADAEKMTEYGVSYITSNILE